MHRFHAPALAPGDESAVLTGDEAAHATRVLRLGRGDEIAVFDGRGHQRRGRIVDVGRHEVRVALGAPVAPAPEPPVAITLAQAILRADRMDDVIRDAVMLGVQRVQPLLTRRSAAPGARPDRLERWRRVALASVKQSRRAVLPEIAVPMALASWLAVSGPALRLMFVEPAAGAPVDTLKALPAALPAEAAVIVGPEGGWAPEEWSAATASGVRLVTLGGETLRADAVPVAALSVLRFLWEQV